MHVCANESAYTTNSATQFEIDLSYIDTSCIYLDQS